MVKKATEKKCPLCGALYAKKSRYCPNCGYIKPQSLKNSLIIFVVFSLLFSFLFINKKNDELNNPSSNLVFEEIKLNDMTELSGLTKEQIFKKRISLVNNSTVFKDLKDYKPNPEVYQIEDNIPWIGAEQIARFGMKDNKNIGLGLSRSSLAINNPELLISFIVPDFASQKDKTNFSKADFLLPQSLSFNKETNTLKATFNIKSFFEKNPNYIGSAMFIDETNARDFGYNWLYAKKKKNIKFANPQNNFSLRPYKAQGVYKKGNSCAIKTGCNNYSPYQQELVFGIIELPSSLEVKLYKNKPKTLRQEADITYIMLFK